MIKTINGRDFEVIIPRKNLPSYSKALRYHENNLTDFYARPSDRKKAIYDDWIKWYLTSDDSVLTFGVSGANSNTFSLTGTYEDQDGTKWIIYITRAHQRLILATA